MYAFNGQLVIVIWKSWICFDITEEPGIWLQNIFCTQENGEPQIVLSEMNEKCKRKKRYVFHRSGSNVDECVCKWHENSVRIWCCLTSYEYVNNLDMERNGEI